VNLSKGWSAFRRVAAWVVVSLASLIVLLNVYHVIGPHRWHEVIVDTGREQISSATLRLCHNDYEVKIEPGQVTGEFPQNCGDLGPDLLLETATAQYWCSAQYLAGDPKVFRYKIEAGKCLDVSETPRGPGNVALSRWPDMVPMR
jgi:hypothetical protein